MAVKKRSKSRRSTWNKGVQVGRKSPLTPQQIRAIRARLRAAEGVRELALFGLAIDSSLNASDLIQLRAGDVAKGRRVPTQVSITAPESQRDSQFTLSPETREAVAAWIQQQALKANDYLFPTRLHASPHISVRQYARLVESWVSSIGLDPRDYGTQSLRRTKPALILRQTKSLAAARALLGHSRLRSTARFFDIDWAKVPRSARGG